MAAKATGCVKNPPTNVKCTRVLSLPDFSLYFQPQIEYNTRVFACPLGAGSLPLPHCGGANVTRQ